MLNLLPVVLACVLGGGSGQPCSASVPVATAASPLRIAVASSPVNAASSRLTQPRPQQGPTMRGGKTTNKALIVAGVVAGIYAGAALAEASSDSPDGGPWPYGMIGGGAIGGLLVWQMVR